MSAPPRILAVVPVKRFDAAKQRLGAGYGPEFRIRLARTMVEDVLAALAGTRSLAGLVVVTEDAEAAALARRYGAEICADGATAGHTGAVTAGARFAAARGAAAILTVPGDIPGITPAEVERLVAAHGVAPAFTIVPAHDRRGSNAILASPPDAVPFAFGDDSFLPHLAAARARGIEPAILPLDGIGLDVDNPGDLAMLAARRWPTRTQALLDGLAAETGAEGRT